MNKSVFEYKDVYEVLEGLEVRNKSGEIVTMNDIRTSKQQLSLENAAIGKKGKIYLAKEDALRLIRYRIYISGKEEFKEYDKEKKNRERLIEIYEENIKNLEQKIESLEKEKEQSQKKKNRFLFWKK